MPVSFGPGQCATGSYILLSMLMSLFLSFSRLSSARTTTLDTIVLAPLPRCASIRNTPHHGHILLPRTIWPYVPLQSPS